MTAPAPRQVCACGRVFYHLPREGEPRGADCLPCATRRLQTAYAERRERMRRDANRRALLAARAPEVSP